VGAAGRSYGLKPGLVAALLDPLRPHPFSPMRRFLLATALLSLAVPMHAQTVPDSAAQGPPPPPPIIGQIQGKTYISPTGAFKVPIPVLPELGGFVTDTPNVVTFQDAFTTHISIAAFPLTDYQRWELETKGAKDFLHAFFVQYVLPDFQRSFPKIQVNTSAIYIPSMYDGAFLVYILLPGGSMFSRSDFQLSLDAKPPVAKRGNLLFVRNGYVYVISTELAERVTEGTAYKGTDAEENSTLRQRLIDIARQIDFTKPAPAGKS
jgi:hypothetical protein